MAKKRDTIQIETWISEKKHDMERNTGRLKFSGESGKKIRKVEFSLDLNDHCKVIDESCWEVFEMQQFATVSGTLRSWRFGCDGQAKSFTSHLGAYELIWRVVTYSKYFFQEYKKSIQRSKVREDTVEIFMWLLKGRKGNFQSFRSDSDFKKISFSLRRGIGSASCIYSLKFCLVS